MMPPAGQGKADKVAATIRAALRIGTPINLPPRDGSRLRMGSCRRDDKLDANDEIFWRFL